MASLFFLKSGGIRWSNSGATLIVAIKARASEIYEASVFEALLNDVFAIEGSHCLWKYKLQRYNNVLSRLRKLFSV